MLDIIILAAGQGTRMKSALPKVLHPIAGRAMVLEVLATARALEAAQTVIVVGHGAAAVQAAVGEGATFALQMPQLGTGHAVMQARAALEGRGAETVLVLYGDSPLITAATLRGASAQHAASGAAVTLLGFIPPDPTGYGRIARDGAGAVVAIVEHKDASEAQRAIRECNSGFMLFDGPWLWTNLDRLALSPQGEYYLTDTVALAVAQGRRVEAVLVDAGEVGGVNDRAQLAAASAALWERRRRHWMREGVTLADPAAVWLDADVTIGADTVIHPNVILRGQTHIGHGCTIGSYSLLEDAVIADGISVAPFTHIRGETLSVER